MPRKHMMMRWIVSGLGIRSETGCNFVGSKQVRKEGRKESRKGREEGRKEGREEGRKGGR